MFKKTTGLIIFCLALAGCVMPGSPDEVNQKLANERAQASNMVYAGLNANPAVAPLPNKWQEMVKSAILPHLKDPDSARFTFNGQPEVYGFSNFDKSYTSTIVREDYSRPLIGWTGMVQVNAKNSFGGYAGNQGYLYIFKNGRVVFITTYSDWTSMRDAVTTMRIFGEALEKKVISTSGSSSPIGNLRSLAPNGL